MTLEDLPNTSLMVRILKTKINDEELAARMRNDDQRAFELIYNRYFRKVFCFSVKYLQNRTDAEDLIQAVFINLWTHRKSLDVNQPVKSYIFRSVVNQIYNYLKRRAVRTRFLEYELKRADQFSNQTYEQVYLNDLEKSVSDIVDILPPQQRRIFYLSRGKGYSYEKIAQKLDISVRTVENQIFRTLKIIRKRLAVHN